VALGEYGTTLLDELNRLANGGTYRAPSAMVGEALAAKQWATFLNIETNLTDTVGILNAIAGTTSSNRLDYSGVCNFIAGTFQLPAAQALRQLAGTPPGPVVAGGVLTEDSNYFYRTFLANDTLTISNSELTGAQILLIAGGGVNGPGEFWGGANREGGGGGAGGLINESALSLGVGSYSVLIGAGGGNDSSITGSAFTRTSIGGGFGANLYYYGAGSGGSGGGGDWGSGGGAGTAGQGYAGGSGYRTSGLNAASGGGGGAGGPGFNAVVSGSFDARGGVGRQFSDWAIATSTGVSGYYAGGGGGRWSNDDIGADGLGGGGGANTGSGGTVSRHGPGSGLFILRWAK